MSESPPFFAPKPNVVHKGGKLYVFAPNRVSVLRGWPAMAAWTRSPSLPGWCRFRPNLDIQHATVDSCRPRHRFRPVDRGGRVRSPGLELPRESGPDGLDRRREAVACFVSSIPHPVREAVRAFPTRHWHLLSMAARCPGTSEFLLEHPALAFGMGSCWAFGAASSGSAMRWIRSMLPRRRRSIAAGLGFPETDLAVRILGRIPAAGCSVWMLLALRGLLREQASARLLAHLPVLDLPVLSCLCVPRLRAAVTPAFLYELCRSPDREGVPALLSDLLLMHWKLDPAAPPPRPLHSMASLTRRHDAAARNLSRRESARMAARKDTVLPGPPLPGTPEIEPIETVSEILREADTQENCVASKIDAVLGGSYYLYRMHVPERATLALMRDEGGWELAEIAGAGNARVSEAAACAVRAWLAKATRPERP